MLFPIEYLRTPIIHPITTLSTLSHVLAAKLLLGLLRVPSTNPNLFLLERAIVMTLFQFEKPLSENTMLTIFWLLSKGWRKYTDGESTMLTIYVFCELLL